MVNTAAQKFYFLSINAKTVLRIYRNRAKTYLLRILVQDAAFSIKERGLARLEYRMMFIPGCDLIKEQFL